MTGHSTAEERLSLISCHISRYSSGRRGKPSPVRNSTPGDTGSTTPRINFGTRQASTLHGVPDLPQGKGASLERTI